MVIYEYGDLSADNILIQPIGEHELDLVKREAGIIMESAGKKIRLLGFKVDDWNAELSPWKAPAVFGSEDFGNGAKATLSKVLELCTDNAKTYYIGGYSLAGLFALWAVHQTDRFKGAAAASPSVWFPGFLDFIKKHQLQCNAVYLSLGNKEDRTRNSVMCTVSERIREAYDLFKEQGLECTLEWNSGNHFKEPEIRTAKAFAWLLELQ